MHLQVRMAFALAGFAVVGWVGAAPSASTTARTTLIVTDAAGDTIAPGLAGDISKVTLTTTRRMSRTSDKPKALTITMDLHDAVSRTGTTAYEVDVIVAGCGLLRVYTTPGALRQFIRGSLECDSRFSNDDDPLGFHGSSVALFTPEVVVTDKRITFRVDFAENVRVLKAGTRVGAVRAFTHLAEPVQGDHGTSTVGYAFPPADNAALYIDQATTSQSFSLG